MNTRTRKWKIAAGVILPALLGWTCLIFLFVLTEWLPYSVSRLFWIPLLVAWLVVLPVSGFAMGVLNALLWRDLDTTPESRRKWSNAGLWLYYVPLLLLSYGLLLPLFPITLVTRHSGQERGQQWLDEEFFAKFFDLKPHHATESSSTKP